MSPSALPDKFKGFGVTNPKEWSKTELVEWERKKFCPKDVAIKIVACGLCGTDIHTIQEVWRPLRRKDAVVGHEIVGEVIAVGDEVKSIKVGDRVGVGASCNTCQKCVRCENDDESYCPQRVSTYNSVDVHCDDFLTQGGYASHSIADESCVFPIPDGMSYHDAAPLMCAGLTVYSPIVREVGRNAKGKTVGIIGIGGLGHLAIQFANALGAEVVAFSRSSAKKEEAKKLGAHHFVAIDEDKDWTKEYANKIDFMLNCASQAKGVVLANYLSVMKVNTKYVSVGLPPLGDTFEVSPFTFISNATSYGSSALGSKKEANEMLELAAEKGVKPWLEVLPISEKNIKTALERVEKGDIRYRFVFSDFDKAF